VSIPYRSLLLSICLFLSLSASFNATALCSFRSVSSCRYLFLSIRHSLTLSVSFDPVSFDLCRSLLLLISLFFVRWLARTCARIDSTTLMHAHLDLFPPPSLASIVASPRQPHFIARRVRLTRALLLNTTHTATFSGMTGSLLEKVPELCKCFVQVSLMWRLVLFRCRGLGGVARCRGSPVHALHKVCGLARARQRGSAWANTYEQRFDRRPKGCRPHPGGLHGLGCNDAQVRV
jgi:hypothetical protein